MKELTEEQKKANKLFLYATVGEMLFNGLMAWFKFSKNPYYQIKLYNLKPRIKKPRKAYRKIKNKHKQFKN